MMVWALTLCIFCLALLATYYARKMSYWRGLHGAQCDLIDVCQTQNARLRQRIKIFEVYESSRTLDAEARRDPIVDAVRADLLARSQVGIQKYGTTLADSEEPLRKRLQHLYEELLDGANYVKWAVTLIDDGVVLPLGGDPQSEQFVDWALRTGRTVEPGFVETFEKIAPDEVKAVVQDYNASVSPVKPEEP